MTKPTDDNNKGHRGQGGGAGYAGSITVRVRRKPYKHRVKLKDVRALVKAGVSSRQAIYDLSVKAATQARKNREACRKVVTDVQFPPIVLAKLAAHAKGLGRRRATLEDLFRIRDETRDAVVAARYAKLPPDEVARRLKNRDKMRASRERRARGERRAPPYTKPNRKADPLTPARRKARIDAKRTERATLRVAAAGAFEAGRFDDPMLIEYVRRQLVRGASAELVAETIEKLKVWKVEELIAWEIHNSQ